MSGWEVVRLDELPRIPVEDADVDWRPVRRTLGIRAFGINAYTADEAGRHVVEEHTEEANGHEEVYVVVAGRARFTVGGEELDAGPGTLVYVRDPAVTRAALAAEPGTTVLAVGGKPGEAYEPSAWEWWFAAAPHYQAGEWEEGLAIVRQGLEERPDHGPLLYQAACYAALGGRREEALDYLERAAGRDERAVRWAAGDRDLDAIRDDPRFPAAPGT